MTITLNNAAYAVSAAFDSVDSARVRVSEARCAPLPQAVLWTPGPDTTETPRKRHENTNDSLMIPADVQRTGMSDPCLRRCPV